MSRWRVCVLPSAGLSQPLLVDGHGISNKILCLLYKPRIFISSVSPWR